MKKLITLCFGSLITFAFAVSFIQPVTVQAQVTATTSPQIVISLDPASPITSTVQIPVSAQAQNVPLAVFDVKSQGGVSAIQSLAIRFDAFNVDISTPLSSLFSNISIKIGGQFYSGTDTGGRLEVFNNLNIPLPANAAVPVTLYVNTTASSTLNGANITAILNSNTTYVHAIDTNGVVVPVTGGNIYGNTITFAYSVVPTSVASLDTVSPITSTLSTPQSNITFAVVDLTAGPNPITNMNGIQVGSDSLNAPSLSNIKVYDGTTLLGTAPSLVNNGSYYYQWINVSNVNIPANTTKQLRITGDVTSSLLSTSTSIRLGITGLNFNSPGASTSGLPIYGMGMYFIPMGSPVTCPVGFTCTNISALFSLSGSPTFTQIPSVYNQYGYSTTTYTATFNVNVQAIGGSVNLGLPNSISPAFGFAAKGSNMAVIYKNGALASNINPNIVYSQPTNTILSSDRTSFQLAPNQNVTIPVTYMFQVANPGADVYGLQICGIGWNSSTQSYTVTPVSGFTAGATGAGCAVTPPPVATPSITVVSPNGGENYGLGQNISINWSTTNAPANGSINLNLDNTSGVTIGQIASGLIPNTTNSYNWNTKSPIGTISTISGVIPQYLSTGQYKIDAELIYSVPVSVNNLKGFVITTDLSDATFTISSSTSSTSCYTFTKDLSLGATGTDVTALQKFLVSRGFLQIQNVTGYFNTVTLGALIHYQATVSIPATGYFGAITRAYINNLPCVPVVPPCSTSSSDYPGCPKPIIHLTSTPVTSTSGYGMNYRVTFDGARYDPADITLEISCSPQNVLWTTIGGEKANQCTNVSDYNTGMDMQKFANGDYRLTVYFTNTSSIPQLVGTIAKMWGGVDGKTLITTDKDAITVPVTTTVACPVGYICSVSGGATPVCPVGYICTNVTANCPSGYICMTESTATSTQPMQAPVVSYISPTTATPLASINIYGSGFYSMYTLIGISGPTSFPSDSPNSVSSDGTQMSVILPSSLLPGQYTITASNLVNGKWVQSSGSASLTVNSSPTCPAGYVCTSSTTPPVSPTISPTISYSCPAGQILGPAQLKCWSGPVVYSCPTNYTLSGQSCTLFDTVGISATKVVGTSSPDYKQYTCPTGYTLKTDNRCYTLPSLAPASVSSYGTFMGPSIKTYTCPTNYILNTTDNMCHYKYIIEVNNSGASSNTANIWDSLINWVSLLF